MADTNGGVPLSGKPVYDKDLYGGATPHYDRFAAVEEDELDERERAVARYVGW
jgi:hypothetical protein